jgi:hypothetical protein
VTPEERAELADSINAGQAIVCYANCYSCMFDCHFNPPEWHTWADPEDIEHAAKTGQPSPAESRCACSCADAVRGVGS